jgi:hypothetical protein
MVEPGRSWMGIASFVLGLLSAAAVVSFICKVPFFGDYGVVASLLLASAAIALGMRGISGKGKRSTFAIIGLWISAAALTALVVEFFHITLSAR